MAETETFQDQKKLRKAELIIPPNVIKQKIGAGGIDEASLTRAQEALDNNTIDFKPIAAQLLEGLKAGIQKAQNGTLQGEAAIEALLYPTLQLKAQGAMFRFPLITEISDILVNFLETVTKVDKDAIDIIMAHKMAMSVVLSSNMMGHSPAQGPVLKSTLMEACGRYYKARKS